MLFDFSNNCSNLNKAKIVSCSLGLNKTEYKIFNILLENYKNYKIINKEINSVYLESELNIDISNIQRSLKKLLEKDLIIRTKKNLSNGGYIYVYELKDIFEIKKKIIENTNILFKKIEQEILNI
jgi:predicted transcriptional regulator